MTLELSEQHHLYCNKIKKEKILKKELEISADAVEEIIKNDVDKTMCKFNGMCIEE